MKLIEIRVNAKIHAVQLTAQGSILLVEEDSLASLKSSGLVEFDSENKDLSACPDKWKSKKGDLMIVFAGAEERYRKNEVATVDTELVKDIEKPI